MGRGRGLDLIWRLGTSCALVEKQTTFFLDEASSSVMFLSPASAVVLVIYTSCHTSFEGLFSKRILFEEVLHL
jgi:hypothetical protein